MPQPGLTREALALELLDRIATAEGMDVGTTDRAYTLSLLRDILGVIDGGQAPPGGDAQVVSLDDARAAHGSGAA